MLNISLIGPGKLGMSLTRLWLLTERVQLESIVARNIGAAKGAIADLENDLNIGLASEALDDVGQIKSSGLILLTTPDDVLLDCAKQLGNQADLSACQQLLFCSGSIEAAAVADAINHRVAVVSVHPMMSFSSPRLMKEQFEGVICTFEGEQANTDQVTQLFRDIGGRTVSIDARAKRQYHLGTVIACNYLNAIRMLGEDHLSSAGLSPEEIRLGLSKLMFQTLENIDAKGATAALTGPLARGDVSLVESQLALLEGDQRQSRVYRNLANILLDRLELDDRITKDFSRLRTLLE